MSLNGTLIGIQRIRFNLGVNRGAVSNPIKINYVNTRTKTQRKKKSMIKGT